MYPALQQKVMEGVELVYNNIPAGRFYEVLKNVSETRHIMLVNYEVISAKWFKSLPPDYQEILVEECGKAVLFRHACDHYRAMLRAAGNENLKRLWRNAVEARAALPPSER